MSRLPKLLKEELISQIDAGRSINKISRELKIAKSTIYYYYKKKKGKRYAEPKFTPSASEIEGEIAGIFAGDGSQYFDSKRYHYEVNVHFGSKHKNYALYVKHLFETYFNKKFRLSFEKNGATIRLKTESKNIYNYFSNHLDYSPQMKHSTVKLKTLNLPLKFKIGFLRGLVDTDGSVIYRKTENRVRIMFYTTSSELTKQVQAVLKELGVKDFGYWIRKNEGYKDVHIISINKNSTDRFLKMVKPFKAGRLPMGK